MFKPVIGINADFANASGDRPSFTYVASGYYDAITKVGGIPLIIPPLDQDEDLEQVLDRVHGVVLVGGADLDPRSGSLVSDVVDAALDDDRNARQSHSYRCDACRGIHLRLVSNKAIVRIATMEIVQERRRLQTREIFVGGRSTKIGVGREHFRHVDHSVLISAEN